MHTVLINLQAQQSPILQFVPFLLVLFIIYFFFIRPQAKKQKEQNAFTEDLKKGDTVVTGSGIVGKVSKIEDGMVTLEVSAKTFIPFVKGAINKDMTEALKAGKEVVTGEGK